jgi:hypothetical protein
MARHLEPQQPQRLPLLPRQALRKPRHSRQGVPTAHESRNHQQNQRIQTVHPSAPATMIGQLQRKRLVTLSITHKYFLTDL